jgi:hypothetical protein
MTGEPLTGAWTMVRRQRDGGGASAQKGDGVGMVERRRGQSDGVLVFHRGGGRGWGVSFYRDGEGRRGGEGG